MYVWNCNRRVPLQPPLSSIRCLKKVYATTTSCLHLFCIISSLCEQGHWFAQPETHCFRLLSKSHLTARIFEGRLEVLSCCFSMVPCCFGWIADRCNSRGFPAESTKCQVPVPHVAPAAWVPKKTREGCSFKFQACFYFTLCFCVVLFFFGKCPCWCTAVFKYRKSQPSNADVSGSICRYERSCKAQRLPNCSLPIIASWDFCIKLPPKTYEFQSMVCFGDLGVLSWNEQVRKPGFFTKSLRWLIRSNFKVAWLMLRGFPCWDMEDKGE